MKEVLVPALGPGLSLWKMGAMAPGDYERQRHLHLKKLAEQGFELVHCIKMLATKLDEWHSIPGTHHEGIPAACPVASTLGKWLMLP